MRIALDARVAQSDRVGLGVYVLGLVRALARAYPEHQLLLLTSPRLPELDLMPAPNIEVFPVAPTYQEYFARDWWEQWDLPRLLTQLAADVYHAPNYTLPVLRSMPCPAILTLYDASLFVISSAYRARHAVRVRFLITHSVKRAAAVVFGSRHAQAEFRGQLGSSLPALQRPIYIGVPEDIRMGEAGGDGAAEAAVVAKYKLSRPYAIAVGSIHPRKNYARLIEAVARPGMEGCNLVLAGSVAWKADAIRRTILDLGMEQRVTLTGFVETAELSRLIRGAVMLVFPSLYEGFGIPPLEAFALGVPVCASNATSIPEVVGDAAVLFDPRSVDDIASAMSRMLGDRQLRADLVLKGRIRLERFSWKQCAREHVELYCTVASKRARSTR